MKLTVAGACPGLMQSNPGLHRLVAGTPLYLPFLCHLFTHIEN
jgi:hypothetical protein